MNVEILYLLARRILEVEEQFSGQQALNSFLSAIESVVASPNDPSYRSLALEALNEAKTALNNISSNLSFAQKSRLEEFDLLEYCESGKLVEISGLLASDPISATPARDELKKYVDYRKSFLGELKSFRQSVLYFYREEEPDEIEEAQIGFQIPRKLFANNLDGLQKELNTLKFIINCFSNATIGESVEIEVGQISTSDPLLFFGFDVRVIAMVAASITWCLDTWQRVDDLVEQREQVKNTPEISDLHEMIDQRIEAMIEKEIAKRAIEIQGSTKKGEQLNQIELSLRMLLERVERGMTVELRLPKLEAQDDGTNDDEENGGGAVNPIGTLYASERSLAFPKPRDSKILRLEVHEPDAKAKGD